MRRLTPYGWGAALVTLAACGPHPYYGTATVTDQEGDPAAVINPDVAIQIPEGSAASAHIILNSLTGGTMNGDIQSQDTKTLEILHTPHDGNTYVFLGHKVGLAEVTISTDGAEVRSLMAVVSAPSPFGVAAEDGGATDAGSDAGAGDAGAGDATVTLDSGDADGGDAGPLDASDGDVGP